AHLGARGRGEAARRWLRASPAPRQILATGGGVRNGFLWQLVGQQFAGEVISRSDESGVPALARNAAAAAVLAALTCDGVAGNLSVLTGAAGGGLLGPPAPGGGRDRAPPAARVPDPPRPTPP